MSDYEQSMSEEEEEDVAQKPSLDLIPIFKFNKKINSIIDLQDSVKVSVAKLKKIQKKQGGELKLLDILEALNSQCHLSDRDSQWFIQFLSNWQVLRQINKDWNDIRNSKLFGIVLQMFDQVLNNISTSNTHDYFEPIAILFLQEYVKLAVFFSQEQYLVGFVDLLNNLAIYYQKHRVNFEQQDLIENIESIKRGSLFDSFVDIVVPFFNSKLILSNYDLIFDGLLSNLKLIKKPSLKLKSFIQNIHDTIALSQWKTTLLIIPDLPIIKVRPLTPRLKDEFLNGYKKKVPDSSDLKKKQKLMKKILVKEIRDDQQYVNQMKADTDQLKKDGNKQAFKKFSRIMDDANMEYKKLKTTQLNIKRIKKKSKRMGGKHQ